MEKHVTAKTKRQSILGVVPSCFESPAENMGGVKSAAFRRITFPAFLTSPLVAVFDQLREFNVFFG
jgi:hypothetical protein